MFGLGSAVSGMTPVLIGVSRLLLMSFESGVDSEVWRMAKLLRVPSPELGRLSLIVVFIFGLWGLNDVVGSILYLEDSC